MSTKEVVSSLNKELHQGNTNFQIIYLLIKTITIGYIHDTIVS